MSFYCLRPAKRIMPFSHNHPEIRDSDLKEEIEYGCMADPFSSSPFKNFQINRFGIISKSTPPPPEKWRFITDISFSSGRSVTDGIPSEVCHFHCKGIQSAA